MCRRLLQILHSKISAVKGTNFYMNETIKADDTATVTGPIIYNLSEGHKYFTQRDNKIKPFATCNTTSMCMALTYSGVKMPEKKDDEQYEDLLTNYLRTNKDVLAYYKKIDPVEYAAWISAPDNPKLTPPNENHAVLSYGTNLWIGQKVTSFSTVTPLDSLIKDLIQGRASVLSGLWAGFHHIVCMVGFVSTQQDVLTADSIDLTQITDIIVDDPFGSYKTKYQDVNGNDIRVPYKDFLTITREYNSTKKWAHVILPT